MQHIDKAAAANAKYWEEQVVQGDGHTLPWIDIDLDQLHRYIQGELKEERLLARREPKRFVNMVPQELSLLGDVEGKDLLCLACGGGQQSALFALLGAHVTVVDIARGQLEADQKAAAHYRYDVTTIQADMRDLSALQSESMDIVVGWSASYVPDIRRVHSEVARVLRPGGLYTTGVGQPASGPVEWDGSHYRLTKPYANRNDGTESTAGTLGFRHYMDDIFNGLVDVGLAVRRVEDLFRYKMPDPDAEPGSWMHQHVYVGGHFVILSRKET